MVSPRPVSWLLSQDATDNPEKMEKAGAWVPAEGGQQDGGLWRLQSTTYKTPKEVAF